MPSVRHLVLAVFAAFALLAAPAGAKTKQQTKTPPPWLQVQDGVTQPQFQFANVCHTYFPPLAFG